MKFLTMCYGGNCRSVAMAMQLKEHGQDAIAVGHGYVSEETLTMLTDWADYIIGMMPSLVERVPEKHKSKIRIVDVGEDTYGHPFNGELNSFLQGVVKDWQARGWKI